VASLPAPASGATASSTASASASSSRASSCTRPRAPVRARSRSGFGSESSGAEWRDSSRCSLTSNVKRSGVISAQRATWLASGTA
jgi:hypothetical protein